MRPEHVKLLREAFSKTVKDPEFVAEAAKKKLDFPASQPETETKRLVAVSSFL
jgi:hypothetical protein